MEGWLAVLPYLFVATMLVMGFFVGGILERRHLGRLDAIERDHQDVLVTNLKRVPSPETAEASTMVLGQVVIATDYFKTFATLLRNLVGGEMRAANRMMQRGRREALARLVEDARRIGATEVHNVRFGFSNVNQMNGRHGAMQVEILAWGTAVRRL